MPKFLIERELPGAGDLSPNDLHAIARKSCDVLHALGPDIQHVLLQLPWPWLDP